MIEIRTASAPHFALERLAGIAVVGLALSVLIGWHTHVEILVQVFPGFVPMQYNTALGFLLIGAGLLAGTFGRNGLATVCGGLSALLAAATLLEYLGRLDLGIDQAFMMHYITQGTSHPGRMAPNTALCFLLSGGALVVRGIAWHRRRAPQAVGITGSVVISLSLVAFGGYLVDLEPAYGWGHLTQMAVHTAGGFAMVGTGLLGLAWMPRPDGGRLPDWLPVAAAVGFISGTVTLWQAIHLGSLASLPESHPVHIAHHAFLVFGIILALTLAAVIRMAQKAHAQSLAMVRTNAELERFAQVASHDLQEPLRTITTYLQLLEQRHGHTIDEQGREYLGFAVQASRRMSRLIKDILRFSRIQEGPIETATVSMAAAARNICIEFEAETAECDAEIRIDPGLPSVRGDGALIESLLRNLVGNALKYRRPGQPPHIHIGFRQQGGTVFFVADDGIGIEPQYHEKVFEVFRRLHAESAYPGTGIGLAICKRVVERHGGRIWIESDGGAGTTVTFSLPSA